MRRPTLVRGGDFHFPSANNASPDGVVAVGGEVNPTTLRRAYRAGIFPWPVGAAHPMFWFSPDPRFLLELDSVHVPRSLAKVIRQGRFEVRFDTAFADVIRACSSRPGVGTWIDRRVIEGFIALHLEGRRDNVSAHSVEAWLDGQLVGGLYGIAAGACFAGESMFFREPDASKVAFVALTDRLRERGFHFVDCQVRTDNLARFGAEEWPRAQFLERLASAVSVDLPL